MELKTIHCFLVHPAKHEETQTPWNNKLWIYDLRTNTFHAQDQPVEAG